MLENLSDCRKHKSSLTIIVQVKQDFIVIFFVSYRKKKVVTSKKVSETGVACMSVRHSPGKCIIQHGVALIERKREERGEEETEERKDGASLGSCRKDPSQVWGERGRFVRGGKGGVGCEQVL